MESLTNDQITFTDETYAFAGFWRRFAAFLVDSFVLSIIAAVLGFGLGFIWFNLAGEDEASRTIFSGILNTAMLFVTWFYYAAQESSNFKATLGKRVMGIFVTDMQGDPISFSRASGRFFSKILSSILLIGYIMAGLTERKQALHDLIAGTLVIHAHR